MVLRLPGTRDLAELVRRVNDRRISDPTTIPFPYRPSDARSFARSTRRKYREGHGFDLLARATSDGRLLGGFGLTLRAPDRPGAWAEVGYWIAVGEWGQGLASEGLAAMLAAGFGPMRLERIEAWVVGFNDASLHLLRKAGFRIEGRARRSVRYRGRYYDRILLGLLRGEHAARGRASSPRPRRRGPATGRRRSTGARRPPRR